MKSLFFVAVLIAAVSASSITFGAANCTSFCNTVDAACGTTFNTSGGAALTGWNSAAVCVSLCQALINSTVLPGGTVNDTNNNTMGCRAYHAGVAAMSASNAATHCPHVSMISTTTTCAANGLTQCQQYCNTIAAGCPEIGQIQGSAYDSAFCLQACANQNAGFKVNDTAVYPYSTGSNTLACRVYHGAVALATGANTTHCPHASILGGGVCQNSAADAISNFCNSVSTTCGSNYPYTTVSACITEVTAAAFASNDVSTNFGWALAGTSTANTLGCRMYHGSDPSFAAATTHCAHTKVDSAACGNATAPVTPAPTPAATTMMPTKTGAATLSAAAAVLAAAFALTL